MKLIALLASAGTFDAHPGAVPALRGIDPVSGGAAGWRQNPLYVIYGLGGAHNDLIHAAVDDGGGQLHVSPAAMVPAAAHRRGPGALRQGDGRRAWLPFMILARRQWVRRSSAAAAALAPLGRGDRLTSRSGWMG